MDLLNEQHHRTRNGDLIKVTFTRDGDGEEILEIHQCWEKHGNTWGFLCTRSADIKTFSELEKTLECFND